jgi:uncharacterized repeat protein (TIGR01451 family)
MFHTIFPLKAIYSLFRQLPMRLAVLALLVAALGGGVGLLLASCRTVAKVPAAQLAVASGNKISQAGSTVSVTAPSGLALAMNSEQSQTCPSGTVTYNLFVIGNPAATGIIVTDTLPTVTHFLRASVGGKETFTGSGIVTWPISNLVGMATLTLTVQVTFPLPTHIEQIVNRMDARCDGCLPVSITHVPPLPVIAAPKLAISVESEPGNLQEGDLITYTLILTNTGDQDATGITITNTLRLTPSFRPQIGQNK